MILILTLFIILILLFGGARVGRLFSRTVKGTARTTGKLVDKTFRESGSFVKGAVNEFKGQKNFGQPTTIARYCPNCGHESKEPAKFCPICGQNKMMDSDDLDF